MKPALALLLGAVLTTNLYATELELSGRVGIESRHYFHSAQWEQQYGDTNFSVFAEPEFYWAWNDDSDTITFQPYFRLDQHDSERSHLDVRELVWTHVDDGWELKTGIQKVYWGVTEFQHLVDVINQTDAVEDIDGEDKLGQMMINLSLVRDWGIVDLFVLPGFRERTYVGQKGRLRSAFTIDDDAQYQSSAKQEHVDYAIRWTNSIDAFDIGTYWFKGTNRDADFLFSVDDPKQLTPFYWQMDQFGLDVQATLGDWLWKFETIYRDTDKDEFVATQIGFEHTTVNWLGTVWDFGLLMEYAWDSRDEASGQNDIFVGTRIALNDAQSTELLAGGGLDLDHHAYSLIVEASRRLGDSYKLSVDLRYFDASASDGLSQLALDDHLQLTIERYF